MEQWKSAGESHLDLESQYSIMEFVGPDGRRKIVIRKPDGTKELEAVYDRQGKLLESRKFSDNEQDRVFTDPETLAEVDRQVRGLLGERVEDSSEEHSPSAVQDGHASSMEALKIGMLDEDLKMRETLQQYGRQEENPKGH